MSYLKKKYETNLCQKYYANYNPIWLLEFSKKICFLKMENLFNRLFLEINIEFKFTKIFKIQVKK